MIIEYLSSKGFFPAGYVNKNVVEYHSPLVSLDKTPSFYVKENRIFYCHSSKCGGNLIEIIKILDNCSVQEAIIKQNNISGSQDLQEKMENLKKTSGAKSRRETNITREVTNTSHVSKREDVCKQLKLRGLNPHIVALYCEIIYYTQNGKKNSSGRDFYAVGWKNNNGGVELSSASQSYRFKATIDKKGVTFIPSTSTSKKLMIFESMFDFIAMHELNERELLVEKNNILILNSTTSITKELLEWIVLLFNDVQLFLDNDPAGDMASFEIKSFMEEKKVKYADNRIMYYPAVDVNEFVIQQKKMEDISNVVNNKGLLPKDPKKSIFKAWIKHTSSTKDYIPDNDAVGTYYSQDLPEEREKSKNLKFCETLEEVTAHYKSFRIFNDYVMSQVKKGKIEKFKYYFNHAPRGVDNFIV
ncbi:toprim domain-containing protein [Flammeovirga sp. SJP92]|uniref:toprim domain-containing protein n=1 Tax=Flammeovirga sp. SJP92 TaxID=1775430 RepID=UPI000786CC70|nr:toprim domain-containing protein [Flammeovirga sp. SJP92]KXX72729.1 hypothetical protein AVL50_32025 [Flammeovirga sp. SJP92]